MLRFWLFSAALILSSALGEAQGILDGLREQHPRLMISGPEAWPDLAERARSDADLAAVIAKLHKRAREIEGRAPVERVKIGRRLLSVSRLALERIMLLGFAYRTSGDTSFLRRAELELEAAAGFENWNPSHFLDVAEMTTALAIGYDWLYEDLSPDTRQRVREAIIEKGLKPGLAVKKGWYRHDNNWNQVCIGGLCLGALAIADEEPELAAEFLQRARKNYRHGLEVYGPDGIYPEGPSYWSYGTMYSVMMIASLQSALNDDWGMTDQAGFMTSASVYVQTCSPTGHMYNFSDGSPAARFRPTLFWFARELQQPGILYQQQMLLESKDVLESRIAPLTALWWPDTGFRKTPQLDLCWSGTGINPLAIFRESWSDQDAMYLALKGGSASVNHAHMDAGSFILEADGVRWGIDIKQQSYNTLESQGVSLWGRSQDAQRWTIFRYSSYAHNIVTIDGQQQRVSGDAKITQFSGAEEQAYAVVDLSSTFAGQAQSVQRGFQWMPEQRQVLIQDELHGLKPGSRVRWAMVTRAKVELEGSRALLLQDGKRLYASVSGGLKFAVIDAAPPAGDKFSAPNPDTRILIVHALADQQGRVVLAVRLRAGEPFAGDLDWKPISSWAARD